jgi:aminoglycoside 6-adenylyltransferase
LLDDGEWLREIGDPVLTFIEPTAIGYQKERRVQFADGVDVDFSVMPASAIDALAGLPEIQGVVRRGARILLDKDGLLARALAAAAARPAVAPSLPAPAELAEVLNDVLYHVVWAGRKTLRGELSVAAACCNCVVQDRLRRLVEWHANASGSAPIDTWHEGRFLESWAPADSVAALHAATARPDARALRAALVAAHATTGRLGRELAAAVGGGYPESGDAWVRDWLTREFG